MLKTCLAVGETEYREFIVVFDGNWPISQQNSIPQKIKHLLTALNGG
jgi:hypothetical protein